MNQDVARLRRRADERALLEVADDLLRAGVGSRMSTTLQLQERLEVGSGTVQKAVRHLVEVGAVRLRVMGHQGTVIEELDPSLVWHAAGLPPLRIVLPPPGAIETTAITLGVRDQLAIGGVGVELDIIRGAGRRAQRLDELDQPAAMLVSKGAASALSLLDPDHYSWLDFGPQTYYQHDSVVVLQRPATSGRLRVARDPDSHDHMLLTDLAFAGQDVSFVDCPFVQVPGALLDGLADAGVWHQVVTAISPTQAGLEAVPWQARGDVDTDAFDAVLVWRSEFDGVRSLLATLDVAAIVGRMRELVALGVGSPEVRDIVPWL